MASAKIMGVMTEVYEHPMRRVLFAVLFPVLLLLSQPAFAASSIIPANVLPIDEGLLVFASVAVFLWILSLFI